MWMCSLGQTLSYTCARCVPAKLRSWPAARLQPHGTCTHSQLTALCTTALPTRLLAASPARAQQSDGGPWWLTPRWASRRGTACTRRRRARRQRPARALRSGHKRTREGAPGAGLPHRPEGVHPSRRRRRASPTGQRRHEPRTQIARRVCPPGEATRELGSEPGLGVQRATRAGARCVQGAATAHSCRSR